MSFNKAESLGATSGYFRWLGEQKEYTERVKKEQRKPRKFKHASGFDAHVATLDPEWLKADARAMNDADGAAREQASEHESAVAKWQRTHPSSSAHGCDDIFDGMRDAKIKKLEAERAALIELQASEAEERRRRALDNVAPLTHAAPFKANAGSMAAHAGAPFKEAVAGEFHPLEGVGAYNQAKRDFFASYDTNKHTTVNQLLDHQTPHVDNINHSIIHH